MKEEEEEKKNEMKTPLLNFFAQLLQQTPFPPLQKKKREKKMQRLIRCSSHLIFAPFFLFPVHSLHFFFSPKSTPTNPLQLSSQ